MEPYFLLGYVFYIMVKAGDAQASPIKYLKENSDIESQKLFVVKKVIS